MFKSHKIHHILCMFSIHKWVELLETEKYTYKYGASADFVCIHCGKKGFGINPFV